MILPCRMRKVSCVILLLLIYAASISSLNAQDEEIIQKYPWGPDAARVVGRILAFEIILGSATGNAEKRRGEMDKSIVELGRELSPGLGGSAFSGSQTADRRLAQQQRISDIKQQKQLLRQYERESRMLTDKIEVKNQLKVSRRLDINNYDMKLFNMNGRKLTKDYHMQFSGTKASQKFTYNSPNEYTLETNIWQKYSIRVNPGLSKNELRSSVNKYKMTSPAHNYLLGKLFPGGKSPEMLAFDKRLANVRQLNDRKWQAYIQQLEPSKLDLDIHFNELRQSYQLKFQPYQNQFRQLDQMKLQVYKDLYPRLFYGSNWMNLYLQDLPKAQQLSRRYQINRQINRLPELRNDSIRSISPPSYRNSFEKFNSIQSYY